ncbi:tripartite tricarboxylate transporter permease [Mycobacterium sp. NAZ190054]|uniref:tripartite tricarboxylate transporter permease n=1 Tax=Mycobacterium sp. NAZ190054 TaxID=1747766 RepID=UPI0009E7288D|nr:tripartite tricarboxylate transporter permease [Mycobacterium sp. NAZ190054]
MFEAAQVALEALTDPSRLAYLLLGVLVGVAVGILPGLGSLAGMAVLLPFIYGMDPYSGIALLVGMMAVTGTADTFSSVLLGVPGASASQATILDGYPMTRRGEGARALGASFTASLIGGLVGALALFMLLPVVRPLVLALNAPELLMLALIGVSLVGVLARGAVLAGLITAALGLLISCVGAAPAGGDRYIFGWDYLYGGVSIVLLALGLFAVPEFFDLARENVSIARSGKLDKITRGLFQGARDAVRHIGVVVQGSTIGVLLGVIPGIGGTAVQWIVYGTTQQFAKDKSKFGKGDVRGVIGPEASNNSVDAGVLMPTLMFGIPGNGTTAILLSGMLLLGVQVGPDMVSPQGMPFLLTVIWTLAIANVLATIACFGAARIMVKLSTISARFLLPFLFLVLITAAYQASQRWGDVILVFIIGIIGWWMKRLHLPRPPLLIGFVLGPSIERYLRISLDRYGLEFMARPGVLALAVVLVVSVYLSIRFRAAVQAKQHDAEGVRA